MITIYDVLEIKENASKEEIENSYNKLTEEYKIDEALSEKENEENQMILNKLKIAYDILIDDEKRKKYDKDLASKRAEELIKNVSVKPEENEKEEIIEDISFEEEEEKQENFELTEEEKKQVRKAARKEFETNLKKAQKAEQEYNEAYNKAYNDYLRKMGYKVKEPLTLKKVKNTIITILVIVVVCFIAWKIPIVQKNLKDLYNENFILRSLVNVFVAILNGIFSIFKK